MTYLGAQGEVSARLHPSTEHESRPGVGSIVATGGLTDGDYGLFRGEFRPGTDVAAHFHRTFSESFYVLSGSIEVFDGAAWGTASSGDLVYVPRGGIHGVRVGGDETAEVLTLFTPGIPRERFVMELLEISASGRQLSREEWAEFYARHDQFMV